MPIPFILTVAITTAAGPVLEDNYRYPDFRTCVVAEQLFNRRAHHEQAHRRGYAAGVQHLASSQVLHSPSLAVSPAISSKIEAYCHAQ